MLFAALWLQGALAGVGHDAVTAFVNVSVVPMDSERVIAGQTVLVRGTRIAAIGPAGKVRVPRKAVRVNGRGKFLIPGLADMHAHIPGYPRLLHIIREGNVFTDADVEAAERILLLNVVNGVTTIRVMYGAPAVVALRERVARGKLLSPRIYTATPSIYDTYSPDSAVKIVLGARAAGYDFVKMYTQGSAWDSAVAAARRVGVVLAGHVPVSYDSSAIERSVWAGYASLEHLLGFEWFMPDGTNDTKLRAIAALIAGGGVWICPTLRLASRDAEALDARGKADSLIVRALRDAGVGLLLGTDAVAAPRPGFAVHRELRDLVRIGLRPYDALLTGTRNVAVFFGTEDSTGTVAVGKRADLVLLNGNPLRDIRHTAQPAGVMLGGRWLDRVELNRRLGAGSR